MVLPGAVAAVRCSDWTEFHVCLSIKQWDALSGTNWLPINDVAGDNTGGYGLLPYHTWDLQAPP